MERPTEILYADVVIPLTLREMLTYEVPENMQPGLLPGCRVLVPLGKSNQYTAIVRRLHNSRPPIDSIKGIIAAGPTPLVNESMLSFWEWMAGYYMCTPGDVMKAAIPASMLKMEEDTEGAAGKSRRRSRKSLSDDFAIATSAVYEVNKLTEVQEDVLHGITNLFRDRNVALLHGVTSSGKTEVYFHLIADQLRQGKQVLYMVPEIALTTQLIERINRHFGASSIVYHSRLTDKQRQLVWQRVGDAGNTGGTGATLVLGVRSSIFLPYHNLGLIIVDEEHDGSYKQQDPAPRYNARDAAIILAGMHKARVVLGSATPSIESYHNAVTGKYGLFELSVRHGETDLPEIVIADTRQAQKRKEMVSHFTPELVASIDEALNSGEQVILFRNRRGFAPFVQCSSCGWIPQCRSCSVSLTYHRQLGKLKCHYCGYSVRVPSDCGECGSHEIRTVGFGTEKIEEELRIVFPDARVERMDQDTTRGKSGHKNIIDEFGAGKTDILIGTQMISKGLDFDNLTVVGILDADSLMNYPDFRSYERSFQMMEQVSGRSGRRKKRGRVIIQTGDPRNPVLEMVLRHDYKGMFESQLEERELFGYPPFTRLVGITLKHRQKDALDKLSEEFAAGLRGYFGKRVMGPEYPLVSRLQSWYVKSILIKIEKDKSLSAAKQNIAGAIEQIFSKPGIGSLRINVDVDPL